MSIILGAHGEWVDEGRTRAVDGYTFSVTLARRHECGGVIVRYDQDREHCIDCGAYGPVAKSAPVMGRNTESRLGDEDQGGAPFAALRPFLSPPGRGLREHGCSRRAP